MMKVWIVRVDLRNRGHIATETLTVHAHSISEACAKAERKAAMLRDGTTRHVIDFHATHACEDAPGHEFARVG